MEVAVLVHEDITQRVLAVLHIRITGSLSMWVVMALACTLKNRVPLPFATVVSNQFYIIIVVIIIITINNAALLPGYLEIKSKFPELH
jgi:hypothetical protein